MLAIMLGVLSKVESGGWSFCLLSSVWERWKSKSNFASQGGPIVHL